MTGQVSIFEQKRLFQDFYSSQLRLLENPQTRHDEFLKGRSAKEDVGISLIASFEETILRELEAVRNKMAVSLRTSGLYYHPRMSYHLVVQRLGRNPEVLLEGLRKENFMAAVQKLLKNYSPLYLVLQGPYLGVRSVYFAAFDCRDQLKALREDLAALSSEASLDNVSPIAPFGPTSFGWVDIARYARELSLRDLYPIADLPKKEMGPLVIEKLSLVIADKLFLHVDKIAEVRTG